MGMSDINPSPLSDLATSLLMFVGVLSFCAAVVFGTFVLADFGDSTLNVVATAASALVMALSFWRGVVRLRRFPADMADAMSAEAGGFTYRAVWSPEDEGFVATVTEFPSLSWVADSELEALLGLQSLVRDLLADLADEQTSR